jgi:uncharacterized protein YbbC (DUF1343 family)
VTSLYGERVVPARAVLSELDGVLFDVPDIGARCYTYIWTLTHLIDACADAGLPLWVLDRPNPLGGAIESVEGPLLEPEHASFVGRHTLPVRHSLTVGELALLWRRERRPDADVRVIACDGWVRHELWHDTGLAFMATSPAITTADAALLYPGLAFLEATNVSVGRGSPLSFRVAGAPWLRVGALLERLATRPLPGLAAAADRFVPAIEPHAGAVCTAVRLDVIEPARVRPVATGLALLADIVALHPAEFAWRSYPTAVNPEGAGHLERLVGSTAVCSVLRRTPAAATAALIAGWVAAPGWAERWRSVQLYP